MFLLENESSVRLVAFLGAFSLFAVAEAMAPRKDRVAPRAKRWPVNLALVAIDSVAVRFLTPILAVGAAGLAAANGWGLLNAMALPGLVAAAIAFVALDAAVYLQHVLTHRVPLFWRFHRIHHADRDIDVTTGARFHPLEIVASMFYKIGIVIALGAPPAIVVVFEVALNASAMFNHANWRLPSSVDRLLRRLVVTPDMHRVHHSIKRGEMNANFGFCLSIWDRLFGTYRAQPDAGHDAMTIGLPDQQDERPSTLRWSLTAPFSRDAQD